MFDDSGLLDPCINSIAYCGNVWPYLSLHVYSF